MKMKSYLSAGAVFIAVMSYAAQAQAGHCREYTKTIRIGGELELGVGQACERPDGIWEVINVRGAGAVQDVIYDTIYGDLYDRGYDVLVVNNAYTPRRYYRPTAYYYHPQHRSVKIFYRDDKKPRHFHKKHPHKKHWKHNKHHRHEKYEKRNNRHNHHAKRYERGGGGR